MHFNKLNWFIFPFNYSDVAIFGADPIEERREREDDHYVYSAKVYVRLYQLGRKLGVKGVEVDEEGWYEAYLERSRFRAYTWKEIQPIALDILWKWFENPDYRPAKDYEAKSRWSPPPVS